MRISKFAAKANADVQLALTATATSRVADDILSQLQIPSENMIRLPSLRGNLQLSISKLRYKHDTYEHKSQQVIQRLRGGPAGATIVYVNRQKIAERFGKLIAF